MEEKGGLSCQRRKRLTVRLVESDQLSRARLRFWKHQSDCRRLDMTDPFLGEKQAYVLEWFGRVVKGYMCRDIAKLLEIEVSPEDGLGGCAAPLAMTVFATMDRLGYLTKEDAKELGDTERHIKDFCEEWMSRVRPKVYCRSKTRDLLAEIFRHSLAHQFISQWGTAITKESASGDVVGYDPDKGIYILQVEILAKDLLEAVDHLTSYLANLNKEDLISRVYERLFDRQRTDEKNIAEMHERLKKKQDRDYEIPIIEWHAFAMVPSGTGSTSTTITGRTAVTSVTIDPRYMK
jgi:hypothetical protein